jgi:predicted ATPase/DNA-binding CsgD family transcriptional regulator
MDSEGCPGNLPAEPSSFVGREREAAEVRRLLGASRLLTLIGAGGAGKTRLALEVAGGLRPTCPDGVWLTELASLGDASLVVQTLADALGVSEAHGRPLVETLIAHLRGRALLLVIDNCEHLVEAVAPLVEALLRGCPMLRVLATSREPLGLRGETAWSVPPLATPHPDHLPSLDELAGYEAVRLFVERAAAVQPGFRLDERSARPVVDICYRLDGMPLAIELAAARVSVLPVDEIAARIGDRFSLLTSGSRTALPRHRTLRAATDWSYDLLDEPERQLFARLGTFAGGFTLDAAAAVCAFGAADGGGETADVDVLDRLSRLVDKSLVVAEPQAGRGRYHMLETLREYAAARLDEAGETEAGARRHALVFRGLAERAAVELHRADQVGWLERLRRESDNVRAALRRSIAAGEAETAAAIAGELVWFWEFTGRQSEGRAWQEAILAMPAWRVLEGHPGGGGRSLALARARVLGLGFLAWVQGDLDLAGRQLEESLAIARDLADAATAGWALVCLGNVARSRADYAEAERTYEEGLAAYQSAGDRAGEAIGLFLLATVASYRGDYALARQRLEACLSLGRELGDRWAIGSALGDLGDVAFLEGQYAEARRLSEESIAAVREIGLPRLVGLRLHNLGRLALVEGDVDAARRHFDAALRTLREPRDSFRIAAVLEGLAGVAAARRQPERAFQLAGAAEALREAMRARAPAADRASLAGWLAPARQALGGSGRAAALALGRAMSLDETVEWALADARPPAAGRGAPLSARELEVAHLVAEGLTNRAIADRLTISPRTVDRHVENILARLDLASRTQIAEWVWRMGSPAHGPAVSAP